MYKGQSWNDDDLTIVGCSYEWTGNQATLACTISTEETSVVFCCDFVSRLLGRLFEPSQVHPSMSRINPKLWMTICWDLRLWEESLITDFENIPQITLAIHTRPQRPLFQLLVIVYCAWWFDSSFCNTTFLWSCRSRTTNLTGQSHASDTYTISLSSYFHCWTLFIP